MSIFFFWLSRSLSLSVNRKIDLKEERPTHCRKSLIFFISILWSKLPEDERYLFIIRLPIVYSLAVCLAQTNEINAMEQKPKKKKKRKKRRILVIKWAALWLLCDHCTFIQHNVYWSTHSSSFCHIGTHTWNRLIDDDNSAHIRQRKIWFCLWFFFFFEIIWNRGGGDDGDDGDNGGDSDGGH